MKGYAVTVRCPDCGRESEATLSADEIAVIHGENHGMTRKQIRGTVLSIRHLVCPDSAEDDGGIWGSAIGRAAP